MVIKKKIEKNLELQRQSIIEKGGKVSSDSINSSEVGKKAVILKMPADFLKKVDNAVAKRIGMNRMAWILQAVQEKLERDYGMD